MHPTLISRPICDVMDDWQREDLEALDRPEVRHAYVERLRDEGPPHHYVMRRRRPRRTVRETLGAFVRALREGTAFPISIEDGLRAVAIVDAAYRSAKRGGEGAAVAGFSCAT